MFIIKYNIQNILYTNQKSKLVIIVISAVIMSVTRHHFIFHQSWRT